MTGLPACPGWNTSCPQLWCSTVVSPCVTPAGVAFEKGIVRKTGECPTAPMRCWGGTGNSTSSRLRLCGGRPGGKAANELRRFVGSVCLCGITRVTPTSFTQLLEMQHCLALAVFLFSCFSWPRLWRNTHVIGLQACRAGWKVSCPTLVFHCVARRRPCLRGLREGHRP